MDLFEAINKRHSYRGLFANVPVPRKDLEKIVQAGIQAPSACNGQTTTFVIVDDPELINKISLILGKGYVASAKALIVCVVEERPVFHGISFGAEDCSAAVENMLLAVTALGYATVWLDGCLRLESRKRKIAELLAVPDKLTISIILPVGVPTEKCSQKEKWSFRQRSCFNKYVIPIPGAGN